jgi:hypothetical protein
MTAVGFFLPKLVAVNLPPPPPRKHLDAGTVAVDLLLVVGGVPVCLHWPLSMLTVEMPPYGPNLYAVRWTVIKQRLVVRIYNIHCSSKQRRTEQLLTSSSKSQRTPPSPRTDNPRFLRRESSLRAST